VWVSATANDLAYDLPGASNSGQGLERNAFYLARIQSKNIIALKMSASTANIEGPASNLPVAVSCLITGFIRFPVERDSVETTLIFGSSVR
jgi:hypothetical protein